MLNEKMHKASVMSNCIIWGALFLFMFSTVKDVKHSSIGRKVTNISGQMQLFSGQMDC